MVFLTPISISVSISMDLFYLTCVFLFINTYMYTSHSWWQRMCLTITRPTSSSCALPTRTIRRSTPMVCTCLRGDWEGEEELRLTPYTDSVIGALTASIAAKGNYVAMYAANMPAKNDFIWVCVPSPLQRPHSIPHTLAVHTFARYTYETLINSYNSTLTPSPY